jgi:hypothetical protein
MNEDEDEVEGEGGFEGNSVVVMILVWCQLQQFAINKFNKKNNADKIYDLKT